MNFMDFIDSINTLEILSEPHDLTQAKFRFNRKLYENVKWEIRENVLYFEGDMFECDALWKYRDAVGLNLIEDLFIQTRTERHGFLWSKKREYRVVIGHFIYKKRVHIKISTNIWSVIDYNEGGS